MNPQVHPMMLCHHVFLTGAHLFGHICCVNDWETPWVTLKQPLVFLENRKEAILHCSLNKQQKRQKPQNPFMAKASSMSDEVTDEPFPCDMDSECRMTFSECWSFGRIAKHCTVNVFPIITERTVEKVDQRQGGNDLVRWCQCRINITRHC